MVKAIKTVVKGEHYFSDDIQNELLKVALGKKQEMLTRLKIIHLNL